METAMRELRCQSFASRQHERRRSNADLATLKEHKPAVQQVKRQRSPPKISSRTPEMAMSDVKRLQELLTPEPEEVPDTSPNMRQSLANELLAGFKSILGRSKIPECFEEEAESPIVRHQLVVTIVRCKGVRNRDKDRNGLSDPYCSCMVVGRPRTEYSEFHTEAIHDTLDAEWNHTGTLTDFTPGDSVRFTVRNKNYGLHRSDELLGEATLAGAEFWPCGFFEGEVCLTHAGSGYDPLLKVRVKVVAVHSNDAKK